MCSQKTLGFYLALRKTVLSHFLRVIWGDEQNISPGSRGVGGVFSRRTVIANSTLVWKQGGGNFGLFVDRFSRIDVCVYIYIYIYINT